jgi:hypothetical protein
MEEHEHDQTISHHPGILTPSRAKPPGAGARIVTSVRATGRFRQFVCAPCNRLAPAAIELHPLQLVLRNPRWRRESDGARAATVAP